MSWPSRYVSRFSLFPIMRRAGVLERWNDRGLHPAIPLCSDLYSEDLNNLESAFYRWYFCTLPYSLLMLYQLSLHPIRPATTLLSSLFRSTSFTL